MTYISQREFDAIIASELPSEPPYLISGVKHTQFSVARHYGGATFNGWHYTYMADHDQLIRDDVLKWVHRRRRAEKKLQPKHNLQPKQESGELPL